MVIIISNAKFMFPAIRDVCTYMRKSHLINVLLF